MLQTTNQLLKRTEAAVRSRVPPKLKPGLEKAIDAGLAIMYSQGGSKLMKEQIDKDGDPAVLVAEGAAKLVGILIQQSRNTMPPAIGAVAVTLFALEALDVMNKTQGVEITNDLIAQTIQEAGSSFLQLYGVTPEKLQQMAAEKQGKAGPAPEATPGIIGAAAQPAQQPAGAV